MSSTARSTDSTLHATFLFHCAFVRSPDRRRTDVLLSPGPVHANGNGHEATQTEHTAHNGRDETPAPARPHRMQHIASLRIPEACVAEDRELEGTLQETVRFNGLTVETVKDKYWRLEGYDVSVEVGTPVQRANTPPASVAFRTTDEDGGPFVIADFASLSGLKIDERCMADGPDFPDFLRDGARVRLWGGTLQCGLPQGALRTRRWDLGLSQPVGLSDRMEYRKQLGGSQVLLRFTPLRGEDTHAKVVRLRATADGIIRLTISNDPFADDLESGSRQTDPCGQLRHFASYSMLLFPAGEDKTARLRPPVPIAVASDGPLIVTEGNSVCCPCGDGGDGDGDPPSEP